MGSKKTKGTQVAQSTIPEWMRPYVEDAMKAIQGLQFPQEWYDVEMLPGIGRQAELMRKWQTEGIYDPETMESVYRQALRPGAELELQGFQKLLGGQRAAGKLKQAGFREASAKKAQKVFADARKQLPALVGKQAEFQRGLPKSYGELLGLREQPQEFELKKAQAMLGGTTPYKGQTTYTEQKQPGRFFGLF